MSKLFIFGIGGTGSRVLRSLTMLMAAGVKFKTDEIVPIIVDPDANAGDMERTIQLMKKYESIRRSLNQPTEGFYGTKINLDIVPSVFLPLNQTNQTFQDYISYNTLDPNNKALASLLFSVKNLNADMAVGFKGNPNIGSVVMNQFEENLQFIQMLNNFSSGDKIFIISSIFGGTGASGFPLLAKTLRTLENNSTNVNVNNVKNAIMGAVSVLPYFNLETNVESEIEASTFDAKAKAALAYYGKYLKEVNGMYYIGDTLRDVYKNVEGGHRQLNNAHIIELISALSIADFLGIPDDTFLDNNGTLKITNTGTETELVSVYKEFGLDMDPATQTIDLNHLSDNTKRVLRKPLIQYMLFCKYLTEYFNEDQTQTWKIDGHFDEKSNFPGGDFYNNNIKPMAEAYINWLHELKDNVRSFEPFELTPDPERIYSFIKGIEPKHSFSDKYNYRAHYDKVLNHEKMDTTIGVEKRFIDLFNKATDSIIEEKFPNIK